VRCAAITDPHAGVHGLLKSRPGVIKMHRPLANIFGRRGVEYGVVEHASGEWEWTLYPKVGEGQKTKGLAKGTREDAVAACEAAIDAWKDSDG
jgi:hypothetical protein